MIYRVACNLLGLVILSAVDFKLKIVMETTLFWTYNLECKKLKH